MGLLIPLFIIVGVLVIAPQIGIGLLIVGIRAGLSAATSRLFLGRPVSRWLLKASRSFQLLKIACTRGDLLIILEEMGRLGGFELMVLLVVIRLGDNAYGVPISEELDKETGRQVGIGSVYAALERLERKGFIKSELGEPTAERGGRAKRYFQVTAIGLKEVRETRSTLMKLWRGLAGLQGERTWDQVCRPDWQRGYWNTSDAALEMNP
jgi:PadR family transcriptional regulator PadR